MTLSEHLAQLADKAALLAARSGDPGLAARHKALEAALRSEIKKVATSDELAAWTVCSDPDKGHTL